MSTLNEDLFSIFERACRDEDFEIADQLLHALETLARRSHDTRQLSLAYFVFANACGVGSDPQDLDERP
ncbi:hypothetical protein AU476_14800 [Cupriavidus sp. UYMSc13B]|nr:hypothetical protein AU476_14800 [Cupriavidus sp. UYMSc13B]